MVFVIVHTPRPISKGLDHSHFACLCLLASMLYACVSISCYRLCHAWHPLRVCGCVVAFDAMRPCLDVTIWEASPDAGLLHTYLSLSAPCDAMLTMFVCGTRWLSMHLCTLAHMSMHESFLLVCRSCFNTMKLWMFDPNLHLSLKNRSVFLVNTDLKFFWSQSISYFH